MEAKCLQRFASATLLLPSLGLPVAAQSSSPGGVVDVVEIVGTSPLPGQSVERDRLPYSTHVLRRSAIDGAQAGNTTDLLARRLPGTQVNDVQGSPYQGELNFRGQRASGLLGASQGLSVYLDGVRINEAFGDVVNWDLVPEFALESVALVPGANPSFGLNTLGGAVSLVTVDGRSAPGWRGEAEFGSHGRTRASLSHGGADAGGWTHYVGLGLFAEEGWRDFSDGRLGTLLVKAGRRIGDGDLGLNLLVGRSRLVGNGLVPQAEVADDGTLTPDLGADRREAVYTHPDLTRNRLAQASVSWQQELAGARLLEALAYVRHSRRTTINGDEAEAAGGDDDDSSDAEARRPLAAMAVPNASFNRTATTQRGWGLALGLSGRSGAHQWQGGLSLDRARVGYEQTEQEGVFDDTRGVQPLDEPPELSATVTGRSSAFGVHASDTITLGAGTHLTATLRFNRAVVANQLSTVDDDTEVFEVKPPESFTYTNWNPAVGLSHRIGAATLFASWARNHRVPTVIELGCADPEEPCRLPSGLQADPYLAQVRSTTLEVGARLRPAPGWSGSLALYRTNNRDDILFRSVSVTGQQGYFANFPRTRYQGLDASVEGRAGALSLTASYSLLSATYEASSTLRVGERNVAITPGTRIAGLPRHLLKLAADLRLGGGWSVGADVVARSRVTVAGNEDGRLADDADETVRLHVPGYTLVHLRASWKPGAGGTELFAGVSNLFDRRHASFGALAETLFDRQGRYTGEERDALFTAPGAPRSFTLGVRHRF